MDKDKIKKILVVSLSNIGDAILTFPVVDIILNDFPSASVTIIGSTRSCYVFEGVNKFREIIIYNKKDSWLNKFNFFMNLRKNHFDLVVDLKDSALPFLLGATYKTKIGKSRLRKHMRDKHLDKLRSVYPFEDRVRQCFLLKGTEEDKMKVDNKLKGFIEDKESFIVVAAGSLNPYKRWAENNFARMCDEIIGYYKYKVVFIGDSNDFEIVDNIQRGMKYDSLNVCGEMTLVQSAEILRRSVLSVSNDSAVMHMACYLDKPLMAIFGPSDPDLYGPWNRQSAYVEGERKFYNENFNKNQVGFTDINSVRCEKVLEEIKILHQRFLRN